MSGRANIELLDQHISKRKAKKKHKYENEQNGRRDKQIQPLTAKNDKQKEALKAFNEKQLVVLSGSAGTGKTELMVWYACKEWLAGRIDNIVLTRPYKHLGADYGATKGNDAEKLLPFCMSILNKMKKYLGVGIMRNNFKLDGFENLFSEADGFQIVPIEKIQGMSYNDRTIILADEISNAEVAQVKSLTTRVEEGCQILIAGDGVQSAIGSENGLHFLEDTLRQYPTDYAKVIHFTKDDVVRGGLAKHLVDSYEKMGIW